MRSRTVLAAAIAAGLIPAATAIADGPAPTAPFAAVTTDCAATPPTVTVTVRNPTDGPVWFYVYPTDQPTPVEVPWRIEANSSGSWTWTADVTVGDAAGDTRTEYLVPASCAPEPTTTTTAPTVAVVEPPAPTTIAPPVVPAFLPETR